MSQDKLSMIFGWHYALRALQAYLGLADQFARAPHTVVKTHVSQQTLMHESLGRVRRDWSYI